MRQTPRRGECTNLYGRALVAKKLDTTATWATIITLSMNPAVCTYQYQYRTVRYGTVPVRCTVCSDPLSEAATLW